MHSYAAGLLVTTVVILFFGGYVLYRERQSVLGRLVAGMSLAMAIWSGACVAEAYTMDVAMKVAWSALSYVGVVAIPVLFLFTVLQYTSFKLAAMNKHLGWLLVIPSMTVIIAMTNPMHHLLWSDVYLGEGRLAGAAVYKRGPWFWVNWGYSYGLIAAGVVVLLRALFVMPPYFTRQVWLVLLAVLVPLSANLLYVIYPGEMEYDYTPFFFSLATVCMGVAMLRYHWLDMTPVPLGVLVKHLNEGVLVFDEFDRLIMMNPRGQRLLKIDHGDIGKSADEVLARFAGALVFYRQLQPSLEASATDGDQTIEMRAVELPGERKTRLMTLSDVSERRLAELERNRMHRQLMQSRKMESVGRLAGGIAHDFNNMLMGIMGYAELSLDMLDAEHSQVRAFQKAILADAERSANLVKQLLAYARKQPSRPVLMDINKAVDGLVQLLRQLIGEHIKLDLEKGEVTANFRMDPSQFDQVLTNLVVNARDAIDGTGRIRVSTAQNQLDDAFCRQHEGLLPGNYVVLRVADNGCGMNEEVKASIFEPFFTTKETGSGLGLATVFGVVKQNEGYIYADSEEARGSSFTLLFPSVAAEPQESAGDNGTSGEDQGGELRAPEGKVVLLVEDETTVRTTVSRFLRDAGYEVLVAAHPEEAFHIIESTVRKIDILLTDVVMPGVSGMDVALRLTARYPDMVVVFMSGYDHDYVSSQGMVGEENYFLQKPFSKKELLQIMSNAVHSLNPC